MARQIVRLVLHPSINLETVTADNHVHEGSPVPIGYPELQFWPPDAQFQDQVTPQRLQVGLRSPICMLDTPTHGPTVRP